MALLVTVPPRSATSRVRNFVPSRRATMNTFSTPLCGCVRAIDRTQTGTRRGWLPWPRGPRRERSPARRAALRAPPLHRWQRGQLVDGAPLTSRRHRRRGSCNRSAAACPARPRAGLLDSLQQLASAVERELVRGPERRHARARIEAQHVPSSPRRPRTSSAAACDGRPPVTRRTSSAGRLGAAARGGCGSGRPRCPSCRPATASPPASRRRCPPSTTPRR